VDEEKDEEKDEDAGGAVGSHRNKEKDDDIMNH
jgi:hypothetical protein